MKTREKIKIEKVGKRWAVVRITKCGPVEVRLRLVTKGRRFEAVDHANTLGADLSNPRRKKKPPVKIPAKRVRVAKPTNSVAAAV